MRFQLKKMLAALGLAAGLLSPAMAQEPFQPTSMNHGRRDPIPVVPYAPADNCPAPAPGTMSPGTPGAPGAPAANPNAPNPNAPAPNMNAGDFGAAPSAGTGGGETYNPTMFGDLLAPARVNRRVTVFGPGGSTIATTIAFPLVSAGGFKISDNGSPRPQDRAYFTYNYFSDVGSSSFGSSFDVHRETLGLEKTFLGGNASVGVRVPFNQSSGGTGGLNDGDIGDLSLYGIYAFLNDCNTGNVFSTGLVVTLPTGQSVRDTSGRDDNTTIFQPFIGYIWNSSDRSFFLQAFHSAILTEHATALSQDMAIGWWAYRCNDSGSTLRGVVPTIELHLYTPLDHTDHNGSIIVDNILTVTTGATFMLGDRTTLGVAVGLPVTGPRPNSFEAITTLNWRF